MLTREFTVGGSSGWHVHPGVEIAYVLSGELELQAAGQPVRRLSARRQLRYASRHGTITVPTSGVSRRGC